MEANEVESKSTVGLYDNSYDPFAAGFELVRRDDLTAAAHIAGRRRDARAHHRTKVVRLEGENNFDGLHDFLDCV